MKDKFKIFVVFHHDINIEYYDEGFLENLIFVNVNPNNSNVEKIRAQGCEVINQYEFENFISLGKQYAESEVIYNIYKNQYLIKDCDYVGFAQYDMNTHHLSKIELERLMQNFDHIAFDEHSLNAEYKVRYLMDEKYPNKWIGRGKNCYLAILEDYNNFYGSQYSLENLLTKKINLCCTFFLEKNHFNNMMSFICSIIESKKLDAFDKNGENRMQGGLLERYFGVWLSINSERYFYRPIQHVYDTTTELNKVSLFTRTINFIKRTFQLD